LASDVPEDDVPEEDVPDVPEDRRCRMYTHTMYTHTHTHTHTLLPKDNKRTQCHGTIPFQCHGKVVVQSCCTRLLYKVVVYKVVVQVVLVTVHCQCNLYNKEQRAKSKEQRAKSKEQRANTIHY
jgi:hypothetical protein